MDKSMLILALADKIMGHYRKYSIEWNEAKKVAGEFYEKSDSQDSNFHGVNIDKIAIEIAGKLIEEKGLAKGTFHAEYDYETDVRVQREDAFI